MIIPRPVTLSLARAESNPTPAAAPALRERPASLRESGDKRRAQSTERVEAAIASLLQRGIRVSLPAISAETQRLSPGLPPVAQSTITSNPACDALYRKHAPPARRSRVRTGPPPPARLMRLSKRHLAAALMAARADLRAARARERMLSHQLSERRGPRTGLGELRAPQLTGGIHTPDPSMSPWEQNHATPIWPARPATGWGDDDGTTR